jgi:Nucleotidyltransferase of unknown function (DUF6036)
MRAACGETLRLSVSMPNHLLTAELIRTYLLEVAELLPDGDPQCIVVVGGSLLAVLGLREATTDVDTITRLESSLEAAVAEIATRHDLAPHWLNNSAGRYIPTTLHKEDCSVVIDHARLRVLGAPLQQIFVMKLFAARTVDIADLMVIWNECGFVSPEQAADLYHLAYPHLERDEYLADYIRELAVRAEASK